MIYLDLYRFYRSFPIQTSSDTKKEGAKLEQTPCNILDLHTILSSWDSTTTLDLSFLLTSLRLQTPCKLLYTHTHTHIELVLMDFHSSNHRT
jgi:hypothetical protein